MDSSSDDEQPPEAMAVAAHAIRLHPIFDDCLLGERCTELTLDARWVYSTRRMKGVLCARGWAPEDARQRVATMSTVLTPGWPDFLD